MNLNTKYSVICSKSARINLKVFNLIYLPILKTNAYSIYNILISQKDLENSNFTFDFNFLKKVYNLKLSTLKNSLKKLEALELIRTLYNKDDNEIIFNTLEPLDAERFFSNKKFKKLFIKKTSKKYFESILKEFINYSNVKFKNFKNISSSFKYKIFDDITFGESLNQIIIDDNENDSELNDADDTLENISSKEVNTKKDVTTIINTNDVSVVKNNTNINISTNTEEKITSYFGNDFTKTSYEIFKNKKLEEIQQEPGKYFQRIKGSELTNNDDELIFKSIMKYKLKFEVINCLLEYVYITNDKIMHESYYGKIAKSFIDHNVSNASKAIDYLENAFKYKNNHNNKDVSLTECNEVNIKEIKLENQNESEFDSKLKEGILAL